MIAINIETTKKIPLKNVWIEDSDGSFWTADINAVNRDVFDLGLRTHQYHSSNDGIVLLSELTVKSEWKIQHHILWNPGK